MAITLWPRHSIVSFKESTDFSFRLCERVTLNQKSKIPLLNLKTCDIVWAFLEELEYLDEPTKIKEYMKNERKKSNIRAIRRVKEPSTVYRTGSLEELNWE